MGQKIAKSDFHAIGLPPRAVPAMEEYPALWNVSVDTVYLDTTYCKEQHDFPSQSDVIERTKELVRQHLDLDDAKKTLIAVGSYTIGKERIFLALAEMLDCKVWANAEKTRVLKAIRDPRIEGRLVASPNSAQVPWIWKIICTLLRESRSHLLKSDPLPK